MKCVLRISQTFGQLKDTVKRVSDDEAQSLVNSGEWEYCPKHVYKSQQLKREETGDA